VLACEQPALLAIEDAERVSGLAAFLQQATATPDRIRVLLTSRDGDALRTWLREDPDTALGPVLRAPVLSLSFKVWGAREHPRLIMDEALG
jgi:hypothetical protein